MDMMKKLYDSGDADMKRTIAKAWTEGQEKKQSQMFWTVLFEEIMNKILKSVTANILLCKFSFQLFN